MKKNTIAIIPDNGYNPEQKSSHKAMLSLKFMAQRNNTDIHTSRSIDGEAKCGKKLLDGIDYKKKIFTNFMVVTITAVQIVSKTLLLIMFSKFINLLCTTDTAIVWR